MRTKLIATLLLTAFAVPAFAYQQSIQVMSNQSYSEGQNASYNFSSPTYVERMLISAVCYGHHTARVEVYVDGSYDSLLVVPCTDPNYPVPVRKHISNVTLKFQGRVNILDWQIFADMDAMAKPNFHFHHGMSPRELARAATQIVAVLQENINDNDFKTFLLPIRKAASRYEASAGGRDMLSVQSMGKGMTLRQAIQGADAFLQELLSLSYYQPYVEKLWEISERIDEHYN